MSAGDESSRLTTPSSSEREGSRRTHGEQSGHPITIGSLKNAINPARTRPPGELEENKQLGFTGQK